MAIGVIVHGYIECPGYAFMEEWRRVHRANRRVIRHLPVSDPDWPFITRDMFSVLPLRTDERRIAQYDSGIIHFAGNYKGMLVLEADWLRKFESILSNLCWDRAVVEAEFCGHRYEWEVPTDHSTEQYRKNPPQPPSKWSFRCFSTDLKPVLPSEAIEGSFTSHYHVRSRDFV